jgi:hypothetical protein
MRTRLRVRGGIAAVSSAHDQHARPVRGAFVLAFIIGEGR